MNRLTTAARRLTSASCVPRRFLGSHAHAAESHDGHHHDSHLSPGAAQYQATTATLFGEHTAPGERRVVGEWESWTWLLIGGTVLLSLFGATRPNTNPHDWARDEAAERLRRKAAGEEVRLGVHYAGIRFMRERGIISGAEAAELEAGLIVEPPPPAQLRYPEPIKPLFSQE